MSTEERTIKHVESDGFFLVVIALAVILALPCSTMAWAMIYCSDIEVFHIQIALVYHVIQVK